MLNSEEWITEETDKKGKSKKEVKLGLLERIKKNSTIKDTDVLSRSKFFTKKDMIQTPIPALNIALSGRLDGGLTPGLTVWAGPSKHFKCVGGDTEIEVYVEA